MDTQDQIKICPLCLREIIVGYGTDHHLYPDYTRLKRKYRDVGDITKDTITLHFVCHQKLHSLFTNKELTNQYNSIDKLLQHPDIQSFIKWVKTKPLDFIDTSRQSNVRKTKPRYG
jgi:hypothetical protein